jgi:UDP-2-acetamido-3-amino-2,3-dideoxy-glucuronate N-acetyltransferase
MKSARARKAPAKGFFVHPQALVESGTIGPRTRIWAFAHVMKGARIGANCNIGDHAFIESGVVLGNNVTVKNGVSVWTGVTVEDNVFLGPNCAFTNDPNPRAYIKKPETELESTLVRTNATIGANATLLCGLTIGRYAFIGAGAVVLHSVPDFALMVGNPARQSGWMCACAHKLPLGETAPPGTKCTCPHCQATFERGPEGLLLLDSSSRESTK